MTRRHTLAAALLWATAIIAAAALAAPSFLTLILLPSLAAASLLIRTDVCATRSHTP
jgi:hypothetical protein